MALYTRTTGTDTMVTIETITNGIQIEPGDQTNHITVYTCNNIILIYSRAWNQERIDLDVLDIENVITNDGGEGHVLDKVDLSCNNVTVKLFTIRLNIDHVQNNSYS